jgi:hypothetical protein
MHSKDFGRKREPPRANHQQQLTPSTSAVAQRTGKKILRGKLSLARDTHDGVARLYLTQSGSSDMRVVLRFGELAFRS